MLTLAELTALPPGIERLLELRRLFDREGQHLQGLNDEAAWPDAEGVYCWGYEGDETPFSWAPGRFGDNLGTDGSIAWYVGQTGSGERRLSEHLKTVRSVCRYMPKTFHEDDFWSRFLPTPQGEAGAIESLLIKELRPLLNHCFPGIGAGHWSLLLVLAHEEDLAAYRDKVRASVLEHKVQLLPSEPPEDGDWFDSM
ncbi:MAG: hypothetical protein F2817_19480 [Actinobacteria bacterium]|nr:hypothetical protein [Actinomycetota bacterium]